MVSCRHHVLFCSDTSEHRTRCIPDASKGLDMFTPEQFRAKAAEYAKRIKGTTCANQTREFQALEQRFTALADGEQWLADNYDKTLHRPNGEQPDLAFADEEELMLRCLGTAVVMQWSTLPTKLQRELFNNATAVGELSETAARRGLIARFLHKKNGSTGNEQ